MTEERILDTDILVIGGGMVGLGFACAAASAGIRVTLIDRLPPEASLESAFDGRVSAITAGSARLLETLGIWQGIEGEKQPILEIRVSDTDSPLFLHYDHRDVGDQPFGHIVENRALRRALFARAAQLPGLAFCAPAEVATLDRDQDRATATLADGTIIRARLVVGADGKRSATRAAAGIAVTRKPYRQTAIVCTVAHQRPHEGIAQERFLAAGPFAILPLPGNRSSLVWTERADLAPTLVALDDAAFLAELGDRFTDYLGALSLVGPRWSYPLELSWAARATGTRLVLIGDAAHAIHPIAGQGLNLGLRDVATLAEIVVDAARLGLDIGSAGVLGRYPGARRVDVLTMGLVTDGLNQLFANDIAPIRGIRDLGLAAVERAPALKRLFMRHAMGLVGDLPRLVRGEPL